MKHLSSNESNRNGNGNHTYSAMFFLSGLLRVNHSKIVFQSPGWSVFFQSVFCYQAYFMDGIYILIFWERQFFGSLPGLLLLKINPDNFAIFNKLAYPHTPSRPFNMSHFKIRSVPSFFSLVWGARHWCWYLLYTFCCLAWNFSYARFRGYLSWA